MVVNSIAPAGETGCTVLVVDPSPSSPELLSPQHDTDPVFASLHVCDRPALIMGSTVVLGAVESLQALAAAARKNDTVRV
jgi:hypothetical protein